MTLEQIFGDSPFGLLGFNIGLFFMQVMLFVVSLFMILLVLVQRGKGGGLTGALGGMGGQSEFGSKAGDAFTKITIVTAVVWLTLCMVTIASFNPPPAPKSLSQKTEEQSGTISGDDTTEESATPGSGTDSSGAGEALPGETLPGENSTPAVTPGAAGTNESGGIEIDLEGPSSDPVPPATGTDAEATAPESGKN